MVEHTPGITRIIDRLIKKDLVSRERCPEDRRQVLCYISNNGLKVLKKLDAVMNGYDVDICSQLNKRELSQAIQLLDQLRS